MVTRRPTPPRRGTGRSAPADKAARTAAPRPAAKRPGATTPAAKATAKGPSVRRPGPARSVLPGGLRLPVVRPLTAIGITLAVVTLLLAPYLQPWWSQRSQLNAARQRVTDLQHQVDQLSAENRRWDDPAFVKAQARDRLHYVMPGEIGYVLLDDGTAKVVTDPRQAGGSLPAGVAGQAWYSTVWQSLQAAGTPSAAPSSVTSSSSTNP